MSEPFFRALGLSESPFSKEIADGDLWLPPSKQALVEELCEAVHDRAQVTLVGEPGAGKTCVLRALRHRLPEAGFRLTYCHNATLGRRDFYRQLCLALGLNPAATAAAVFFSVGAHVQELGKERIHPVFLLDESHMLHQDTLDHLHVLLNYEWDSRALLSLVLVGLPELRDRLELRKNRSLYSRIHCRLSIEPMTLDDTAAYVRMRLARVGAERELFAAEALATLHEATGASLREIDRLATAGLREAVRRKKRLVERDVMVRVVGALPPADA
jgi:general secretion pathway protein A